MMSDFSSTPDLSLYKSLYHPQTSMSRNSTSGECKECSPEKLNKEHMKNNLKTLRHTRKILLYVDKKKTTWQRTSSAQQKRGEDFL
jgi:hypothetical protein